jgi:hypothetical protein
MPGLRHFEIVIRPLDAGGLPPAASGKAVEPVKPAAPAAPAAKK